MVYRTELHAHTSESSGCAEQTAEQVVAAYIKAGYDTLVITDHFNRYHAEERIGSFDRCVELIFESAAKAREAAGERINIITAVEIGLNTPRNDYLIYGVTREFLLEDRNLFSRTPEEVYRRTKEAGMLFIQAHPMRGSCVPIEPEFLDGYEIFNGHSHNASNNEKAIAWWESHRDKAPIFTSGTDYHGPRNIINAGILTDKPIKTSKDLIETLRGGEYSLICGFGSEDR